MQTSPFGQYAPLVAVAISLGTFGAWLSTLLGLAPQSPLLDSVALLIVGAIFGTAAGARYVANGAERKAEIANIRLDGINAPSAAMVAETNNNTDAPNG